MGMFDYVSFNGEDDWQTKDLECGLDRYRITADGELQRQQVIHQVLPEEEWPTKPGDEWHGLVGTIKTLHGGWKPENYTGPLSIYRYAENKDWVEWHFVFDHGQVVTRHLLPSRKLGGNPAPDPTQRGAGNAGDESGEAYADA